MPIFAKRITPIQEKFIDELEGFYQSLCQQYECLFLKLYERKEGLPLISWKKEYEKYRYLTFETYHISLSTEIKNRVVRQNAYHEKELWGIICACILALAAFEENNIIHGDVNPNNIFNKTSRYKMCYPPLFLNENKEHKKLGNSNKLYISPD